MTANAKWLLWRDGDRDPFLNMSIDELLLSHIAEFGTPVVRIYGWDRKSVSIGYVQDYEAAPQKGYAIVRRMTGGGVVFHDKDLTYTVVVPAGHPICALDRVESYHVFHRAVKEALAGFGLEAELSTAECGAVDRATMQCFVTPTRYDVLCGGRKYAGAAQRRTRDGILHQGSIDLKASGGDSEILAEKLVRALEKQFEISFIEFNVSREFLRDAEILSEMKYSTEQWNRFKKMQT
jgi:lipoate-protein ligase A